MRAVAALLALEASAAVAQKVVKFPIARNEKPVPIHRRVKRATVTETLGNEQSLYYANVSVGTPGQMVSLQLDTGSSDVWVVSNSANCRQQGQDICMGGTFNSQASSSYHLQEQGGFNISYVDGSGSTGDEFTDVLSIGGQSVSNLTMGLADQTTIGVGIIGVSFAQDESMCKNQDQCRTYPTLPQTLVSQGKISSQAYSLWLDDLESSTGSILFGGIDTSKYSGDLVAIPITPDAPNLYTAFTVPWTGLTLTTPNGPQSITPQDYVMPAILDSGTTTLVVPDDIFANLATQFGAVMSQELQSYAAPCYVGTANATLDFSFAGDGPTIRVNVSEFLIPISRTNGQPLKFKNGQDACQFGIQSTGTVGAGTPVLFGDTFLRSAYVVYDLDNKQIAIAQSNFNAGGSNIKEIPGSSSAIPNVASTATGVTLSAGALQATPTIGPIGTGIGGGLGASGGVASATIPANGKPPLAQYTTGAASGSGAMHSMQAPSAFLEKLMFAGLVSAVTLFGSGMILL